MKLTGSLIVCSIAAAFTGTALLVNPDPAPAATPAAAADAAAAVPGAGVTPQITVQQFAFTSVTARPGEAIAVQNFDEVDHTVSSSQGLFDSGVLSAQGAASLVAPSAPGTYEFVCTIHPTMVGQLTVVP